MTGLHRLLSQQSSRELVRLRQSSVPVVGSIRAWGSRRGPAVCPPPRAPVENHSSALRIRNWIQSTCGRVNGRAEKVSQAIRISTSNLCRDCWFRNNTPPEIDTPKFLLQFLEAMVISEEINKCQCA